MRTPTEDEDGTSDAGAGSSPTCRPAQVCDEDLFREMRTAGPAERARIREELARRHGGLVRWLAARYANPALDTEELRQVGYLGLVLAIERFDPDRGSDFISYARPTVQGEIRRWFREKRRWVRLPRRLQETKAALRSANEALLHRLNREPSAAELADYCGLPQNLVTEALAAEDHFSAASIDAPLGGDGDENYTFADVLPDTDRSMDLVVDLTTLRPLLCELDERDRRVLHLRFVQELTQAQIGTEIGCSQMHVSRMLTRILEQLRAGMLGYRPAA